MYQTKSNDTLEIDIFIILTPNFLKKDRTKFGNIEGTQLVIDNAIYTQKVRLKSPYSEPPHTCSGCLYCPSGRIYIKGQLVGEKRFLNSVKLLKSLISSFVHRKLHL